MINREEEQIQAAYKEGVIDPMQELRRNIPASCPVRGGSFSPAAADGGDVTTGLKGSFPLAAVGNSFPADWFLTFCASLGLAGTPVLK